MKKRNLFKKTIAVALSAAMVAGSGISAMAADYNFEPPTEAMEVDDNIITASVHRAGSVLPEILGMNTVCGFSMINGSMPTSLEEAKTKLMLGVFGTDANESPDPYYYNYFYNFYAAENGLELSEDAVIIPENNIAASPAKADTTIIPEYGTSISLAGRPDVLIGVSSSNSAGDLTGYNELIQAIRDGLGDEYYQEGDEDYDPYLVSYTTETTYDMITVLNETAQIMNEITEETGKVGRYGDPVEIAEQFGDYVCGVSTYVLAELDKQNLDKKTVAVVQNINSDGTFTLADAASQDATSSVRGVEYVALVSDNIAAEVGTTGVTGEELLTADVVIISGSNGGGSDDTALPNTEEGLLQALQVSGFSESAIEDKMIITSNPDSIYGITMNSIENGMGFGYFIGYMYSDTLDIDPVEMCAYFYEQFYHVTDQDSLQSVTNTTFQDVTLPNDLSTDISDYNTDDIDAMLAEGKEYYYENFSLFADTALTKVWPEDKSGIASGTSVKYSSQDLDDDTDDDTDADLEYSAIYNGVDYSLVYDYNYYINKYADLKAAFGTDTEAALKHFVTYGMSEGRQAIESFDVTSYWNQYQDLRRAFGSDLASYYLHYCKYGAKEGRTATGVDTLQNPVTTYDGVNYSAVYDYEYYISNYSDLRKAYAYDEIGLLKHFVTYGMSEGRQASENFDVTSYRYQYQDLRNAYRTDLKSYYLHYIKYGQTEGRITTGVTSLQNPVTTYNGVNYSAVYDYEYYLSKYSDLRKVYADDDLGLLKHFVTYGMSEGRQASTTFNVTVYKASNADLQAAFGNDLKAYFNHYLTHGYKENRTAY